jgi:hypothetical protein
MELTGTPDQVAEFSNEIATRMTVMWVTGIQETIQVTVTIFTPSPFTNPRNIPIYTDSAFW